MLPGMGGFIGTAVVAGSQTYSTPGTYTFTVPDYNFITIETYGAGGGGAYYNTGSYANGSAGNTSSVVVPDGTIQATGGEGGVVAQVNAGGGTGSGPSGTTVATGGTSNYVSSFQTVYGGAGAGPLGGAGAAGNTVGSPYGGGGGGYVTKSGGGNTRWVSGGGGGGYASYTTSNYVGISLTVVVGGGGSGPSGGNGADGAVIITWS